MLCITHVKHRHRYKIEQRRSSYNSVLWLQQLLTVSALAFMSQIMMLLCHTSSLPFLKFWNVVKQPSAGLDACIKCHPIFWISFIFIVNINSGKGFVQIYSHGHLSKKTHVRNYVNTENKLLQKGFISKPINHTSPLANSSLLSILCHVNMLLVRWE